MISDADRRPSARYAFKSRFYRETRGWSATIKVDYDHPLTPIEARQIGEKLGKLENEKPCRIERVRLFTTRKGHHLRVWAKYGNTDIRRAIPELPHGFFASEVLAIQESLGDDPKRSAFNKIRVERGEKNWNVLWNEKWINGRRIMREMFDEDMSTVLARGLDVIRVGYK